MVEDGLESYIRMTTETTTRTEVFYTFDDNNTKSLNKRKLLLTEEQDKMFRSRNGFGNY